MLEWTDRVDGRVGGDGERREIAPEETAVLDRGKHFRPSDSNICHFRKLRSSQLLSSFTRVGQDCGRSSVERIGCLEPPRGLGRGRTAGERNVERESDPVRDVLHSADFFHDCGSVGRQKVELGSCWARVRRARLDDRAQARGDPVHLHSSHTRVSDGLVRQLRRDG